jgi:succinate dehydrogenase/fumarate reductase flavoprotein subunit
MEVRELQADILIIGGGSGGCLAANRALEINPALKVAIFEKGDIKYSGSIARGMDALNIVAIPNFTTPELYVESSTLQCAGILDAPPSHEMARRSFELLKKLEGWGVYFPQDEKGDYRTLQYHPVGNFLTAMEEPNLKVIIARKAEEKGALVVCRAGAVILSSGGTARFGLPNSGYLYGTFDYPGNTGDGYVMGFHAGASLTGMEYTRRVNLIKDVNIPLLAITITRGGKMMDIFDEIVMEWSCHDQTKANPAVAAGKGPLRIRVSHLPEEVIREIESILFSTERPVQERFFKGRGVDFRKGDIELWPTENQLCGGHGMSGLVVNEKAETAVPGLYAAGDVACVSKGHLTGAFVFGEIAAEQAVRFIASQPSPKFDPGQIAGMQRKIEKRGSRKGNGVDVRDLEFKVRRLINDYVISPKNAYKLSRWLEWAERFEREIEEDVSVSSGHELSKVMEVEHIIQCATFSARAALERKESRWGNAHQRTDFPQRDDQNWLCHVDVRCGREGEVLVSRRPLVRKLSTGGAR